MRSRVGSSPWKWALATPPGLHTARQGPLAKLAIESLREALQDADPLVRVKVAEAIWQVERPSPAAILPALQKALKDKNPEVRAAACGVIGVMGSKGKAAVPALAD